MAPIAFMRLKASFPKSSHLRIWGISFDCLKANPQNLFSAMIFAPSSHQHTTL